MMYGLLLSCPSEPPLPAIFSLCLLAFYTPGLGHGGAGMGSLSLMIE